MNHGTFRLQFAGRFTRAPFDDRQQTPRLRATAAGTA